MCLLATRVKWLIIGVFLLFALLPYPVYASTQDATTGPLAITNISANDITQNSATISWQTNHNATSQVFYDTVYHEDIGDYAHHTDVDTSLVTEHSIRLTGLSSATTYHYQVRSAAVIDGSDFIAISGNYTFRTLSPPPTGDGAGPPTYYIETNLFGTTASYRISSSGEILETIEATSQDGMLSITIPKGTIALDKDGKRLKDLQAALDETPPSPPKDAHIIGLAYGFRPDGASFDPPITFIWSYDPTALPKDVAEEDLILAYYNEEAGEWVELESVVDTENNTITASVPHFTTFAIIGSVTSPPVVTPPPPAEEEVVPPEEDVGPVVLVKPSINWPLLGGIIGGVIVVGLLIFFLIKLRR